jgi:hypothetical protein
MNALEEAENRFLSTVERLIPDYFAEAAPPRPGWGWPVVKVSAVPMAAVCAALAAASFGWLPDMDAGFEGSLSGLFLAILVSRWLAGPYAAMVGVALSGAGILCLSGTTDGAQWLEGYAAMMVCLCGTAMMTG